jgi:hypothetical protein
MRAKSISIPARKNRNARPKVESAEDLRPDQDAECDLGDDHRDAHPPGEVDEDRSQRRDRCDDEDVHVGDLHPARA